MIPVTQAWVWAAGVLVGFVAALFGFVIADTARLRKSLRAERVFSPARVREIDTAVKLSDEEALVLIKARK
jgi:hypothetical protein